MFPIEPRARETVSLDLAQDAGIAPTVQITPAQNHEKHPRLFLILPTYSVSNSKSPVSLSSSAKFHLFVKNTIDPFVLGYIPFNAAIEHKNRNLSGYGQGAAGYAKRLSAGFS